jgi:biopolymer transport protein ExbD
MADMTKKLPQDANPPPLPEKKGRRKKKEEADHLNITSITDMMTLICCYLLVTMTSDPLNVKLDDFMYLARSNSEMSAKTDSVPIVITKKHVVVDFKPVATVHCSFQGRECTEEDIKAIGRCRRYLDQCGAQAMDMDAKMTENTPDVFAMRQKDCAAKADKACSLEDYKSLAAVRFFFDKTDKDNGDENQFLVMPVFNALKELVRQKKEQDASLQQEFKGVATVVADESIPFRMLAEVVHTAGMAELSEFRFAVIKTSTR